MIDIINAWVVGLVKVIETAPLQLWAVVLGFLTSWGVTQRIKFFIPDRFRSENRTRTAQLMAFITGLGTTWALWPDRYGFVVAFIVGCFSPMTYSMMMNFMARKFPRTRKVLSMDFVDGTETEKKQRKQKPKIIVAEVAVIPAPTEQIEENT